jgi:hypothetical protein
MIKKRKQYHAEFKAKIALAALEMHWKLPEKADFSVIPSDAYAHEHISEGSS